MDVRVRYILSEYPGVCRAVIGNSPVGLYIVEPKLRAYVGARIACAPRSLPCFPLFPLAGCSYQLETMYSKTDADMEQTGSIAAAERQTVAANAAAPPEVDRCAYARAASPADVVARGAKDASVPWENPNTGAGGNITPLAASYSNGAFTCRDFLASYVRGQAQAWLQGAACRTAHGKWEVKSLRPFKQS